MYGVLEFGWKLSRDEMNDARGMQVQMPVGPASCVVGGEADAEDGAGWGSLRRAGEKRGMKMAPGRDKDGLTATPGANTPVGTPAHP